MKEVLHLDANMNLDLEKIELKRLGRKKGLVLLKKHYDLLCTFILNTLQLHREMTLIELLDAADKKLNSKFSGDVSWVLLHVKHDLETKNLITLAYKSNCIQVISLKRNQIKKIGNFLNGLSKNASVGFGKPIL